MHQKAILKWKNSLEIECNEEEEIAWQKVCRVCTEAVDVQK